MIRHRTTWTLPRTSIALGARTLLMGIVNVTPDSFSDGGRYLEPADAIRQAQTLEQEGADLIDIGGESTRPGNAPVSEEEECRRVLPVIEGFAAHAAVPISVDTYRAGVARRALDSGAQIINDISGFRYSPDLPEVARQSRAGVVLMHSRGERGDIHRQPRTPDPVATVLEGLSESLCTARKAGIDDAAIVLDPGVGFSKDATESFRILKSLEVFSRLQFPILVGTSRKSFIRAVTGDDTEARLWGTAATVAAAIFGGAHIVRIHDVRQMRAVAQITDRIMSAES